MASSKKQYGLIVNKKQGAAVSKSNVFNQSESDDSDQGKSTDWVKKSLQKASENIHLKRESAIAMKKALEEDSTVFQYDEIYDQMELKKTESVTSKEKDKKPRYIEKLLQTSEKRKRENERRKERQVQKDRENEDEEFKDKESFVTSAYKKKLEEFAKLDEEERRQDMLEEIGDVTKQQDISGFYRHLYQSTVSDKDTKSDIIDKSSRDKRESTPETKSKSKVGSEFKYKDTEEKKDARNYRKRKQSISSEDKEIDADTSSASSSSSSESSSESEHDIPLKKDGKRTKRSKSPVHSRSPKSKRSKSPSLVKQDSTPPKKSKLENSPSSKETDSKKSAKNEPDLKTSLDNNETKSKNSRPEVSIWKKRTVGPIFDAALKRYFERKAEKEAYKP